MTVCYWCGAKDTLADIGKEPDDGKYKMVQCSKCKNAYYVVNKEKMKNPKQMTNEEWLRSATTEQLAEFLWERINGAFNSGYACCNLKQDKDYVGRYKRFKEWLKQPHTNE